MKTSLLASLLVTLLVGQSHNVLAQSPYSAAGIALDSAWKQAVYQFAVENLQHSAWGLEHYERNYLLATELARQDSLTIDEEVLFAAAFLHDMGTFAPFAVTGAEHSQTAVDNLESVLIDAGFPSAKIKAVNSAVLAHMYYAEVPNDATAIVLHDADTLDFLGVIGVTRILSLTSRHPWASDLKTALATLENFSSQLPESLRTDAAQDIGRARVAQMRELLSTLKEQSVDGAAL
tara:strand:+ start:196 stop:897 length:702 start_codon:yes stop_codon:yes gene_type:complete